MSRNRPDHFAFISSFVDSATIGTFIEDLRRIKREGDTIRRLPRRARFDLIAGDDQASAA